MSAFQVNGSPRAYIASSLRERTSTVHPHACGEHVSELLLFNANQRFIPTHVGNTLTVQNCF